MSREAAPHMTAGIRSDNSSILESLDPADTERILQTIHDAMRKEPRNGDFIEEFRRTMEQTFGSAQSQPVQNSATATTLGASERRSWRAVEHRRNGTTTPVGIADIWAKLDGESEERERLERAAESTKATVKSPEEYTEPFCEFLTENPTVFHAVDYFKKKLEGKGFEKVCHQRLFIADSFSPFAIGFRLIILELSRSQVYYIWITLLTLPIAIRAIAMDVRA